MAKSILIGMLVVGSHSQISNAYDKNYSLHGVRTSFLLGHILGGADKKYNTSLMYLSNTWNNQERLNFINRIKANGDTHIAVYLSLIHI